MTPDQATAHAALLLIGRLIRNRDLTIEEAVTAVAQRHRRESGPHTLLVDAEVMSFMTEALAPFRKTSEAVAPAVRATAEVMADLGRALQPAAQDITGGHRDRPARTTPYGPPPRRR